MKMIEVIISEIKASEELQKKLAEAAKNNALAEFLKEQGCEATVEEFIAGVKAQASELSDEELGAVAGGAHWEEALLSVFSIGLGCGIAAMTSAIEGQMTKKDGRLLCDRSLF
jgi:predicted ribosomally synthesized peptide with nif11-like leader